MLDSNTDEIKVDRVLFLSEGKEKGHIFILSNPIIRKKSFTFLLEKGIRIITKLYSEAGWFLFGMVYNQNEEDI